MRATLWGGSLSSNSDLSPVPETSKDFSGETEGVEGISRCNLVNKPSQCQPFSSFSLESSFAFQRGSFFISPVVDLSRHGGVSCSEGKASSPEPKPSTLPLEGFQVEGLTLRKMVKVQSVLESLRIRIVRDNGKGVEVESKSTLSADKILSWNTRGLGSRKKMRTVRRSLKWAALPACGASGGIVILWDSIKFKCTEKVLGSFSITVKLNFGGDFNVIRRISEKMGNSRLTFNMRFENMWLLHPEFKEKFRDWWQECTVEVGKVTSRIDLIEQERNLNLDLVSERTLRRKELEDLLLKEEVQWKQKSKVKWIKEGECNSKFFHRVAIGRRSRKFIKSLISERGETLSNIEVISEEIVNFFGKLYSKPEGDSWRIEGIDWTPISGESAVWLDRPFSEEEVQMAVFQLNKEKALGPDRFTIAVYQECWDVIKEDLMRVFLEFHTKGVLSGCLRKVLHETISGSQGAFVEGRHILDAVLIVNEVVDEKGRLGEEGVVFKIDFERAYDHVDWGFLDHVLQRKGFSQKWRSWIRGCLSSSSFAILVNGNAKSWVKASRGLRQGDPLFPFLFTLVVDVLSRLMIRAEETGITEGLPLGGSPKTIGFWDPVVERISRRLDGWKKALLEGKKDYLIRWEVVTRPKELGGLGFGKTSMRNIALLGKWLWRFPRERSGLWHKMSLEGYCSSFPDSRAWSLSSLGLFSMKSFFLALSKVSNPILFLPAKFLWSSKVPSKVKALAWLVAHGKVNTNDKLQLRRPYKAFCPQWCILCKGNGESIDHLFLHCPITIGLWHKLFDLAGLVWVPPRSLEDMLVITFKGLGNSLRGKTLWQIACLTLIWMVWQERNNRIFEDKGRTEEMLWDLIWFYSSLWASCTEAFRGVPLNVLQLNWITVCASKV
ncbi:hypothetical protein CK203_107068 [Vitis vinifera]|uniref:Reverse transcriptase domain-containing protein n=1 Tax=Vitis vinifera TaxID=29760 RepID=A0A438CX86_VITVI|nr:hypothetical protein CK203_107068 [Vitis vinifera]